MTTEGPDVLPGVLPLGPARRRSPTVRSRVLAAVVSLAAVGLAVAGTTAYLLQRQRVDELADASLARGVAELRALAVEGVDPATGEPFTSVRGLLFAALRGTVPAPDEGALAVVDGRVELVAAPGVAVRLEDVPAVVTAAVAAQGGTSTVLSTVTVPGRSYRVAAVPVRLDPATAAAAVAPSPEGVLLLGVDRTVAHAELGRTYRTYALVTLGALAVLAVVGWGVAGRLLAPLRLLRDTARRIARGASGQGSWPALHERIPVRGDDDVSELTRSVNTMLDALEGSFASQRRLLDDAGHELRTPLTIVRGHLELLDPDDPADVRATRDLVVDEVDRMHRLVDDLVTLATVDRPDPVRLAPVDVGRLTDDVLDKARTLGGRRWLVDARAEAVLLLDAQRLTQAWLQLAANAVKFSPEGSTVRLASAVHDGALVLSVTDEGPGVAPQDAERIFERFVRGEAGRGVAGSGLGLPIVRAIARAHGGTAHVDAPGSTRGARFVIEVPAGGAVGQEEGA